jgi:23S rRNA (cytidine2498-2'-O)-methyltransferase
MTTSFFYALMANPQYLAELQEEIDSRLKNKTLINCQQWGSDIFYCESKTPNLDQQLIWPLQIWTEAQIEPILSISDGAHKLRSQKKIWQNLPRNLHRRSQLISEQVKSLKTIERFKHLDLISDDPVWTLIEKNTLLQGNHRGPRTPTREFLFKEDRHNPPSRAYLKLWELFARTGIYPKASEIALDLGACPGGWSWVLLELGVQVYAFDRSPLDARLARYPQIQFHKKDIFSLDPLKLKADYKISKPQWIVSDVIQDTQKLCELAFKWYESQIAENYIFTIKFKGKTNMDPVWDLLKKVPSSRALHLEHNKHEITWFALKKQECLA